MTAFSFNALLSDFDLDPENVTLIRHQKKIAGRPTSYGLWATDRPQFETWQAIQSPKNRNTFGRQFWASFVVPPDGSTLFVGIYEARLAGSVDGFVDPITGLNPGADKDNFDQIGVYDWYDTTLTSYMSEYIGRVKIAWGNAFIQWKQKADSQDKAIVSLSERIFDLEFPGFGNLLLSLNALGNLPPSWRVALSAVRGIYLLTCPKTKELYVGKASGQQGFWGRWQQYFLTGHGGNVGLKGRDPSDYQISILEVCGTGMVEAEIDALESLWKRKLQSREMGLNKN